MADQSPKSSSLSLPRIRCRDPDERIADALGAIGWPVVQAGVSTFLGIVVMLLVPSNVVRMFARFARRIPHPIQ